MGGRSRSRSSNQKTTQITNNTSTTNKNTQLSGNAVAVDGSNNIVNNLAPEVVEDALNFAEGTVSSAFDSTDRTVDRAFDFGDTAFEFGARAIDEVGEATENSLAFAQGAVQQTTAQSAAQFNQLGEQLKIQQIGDSEGRKQIIIAISALGAVVLIAATVLNARKGKK